MPYIQDSLTGFRPHMHTLLPQHMPDRYIVPPWSLAAVVLLAAMLLSFPAHSAPRRHFESLHLPVASPDQWAPEGRATPVPGTFGSVSLLAAPDAASVTSPRLVTPSSWRTQGLAVSVTARVRSNTPGSTWLEIVPDTGRVAMSAFHSGDGQWTWMTVIYPQTEPIAGFRIRLRTSGGQATMDDVRPVLLLDDRFDLPSKRCTVLFRERMTYPKTDRFRIILVGGSTVHGGTSSHHKGTFSYTLQAKLEALYPGRFEIMNHALCGWTLAAQIISLETAFYIGSPEPVPLRGPHPVSLCDIREDELPDARANMVTMRSLEPDLVLLGTMWNDISPGYADIRHIPPMEVAALGDEPYSVGYLRALYPALEGGGPEAFEAARAVRSRGEAEGVALQNAVPANRPRLYDKDLVVSDEGRRLHRLQTSKFVYLLEEFLARAGRWTDVWLFTLPFDVRFHNFNPDSFKTSAPDNEMQRLGLESDTTQDPWYVAQPVAEIQDIGSAIVADRHGLPFANLDLLFQYEHRALPDSRYKRLHYFMENDNSHFTSRGNAYLADRLHALLAHRFADLANTATR